MKDKEKTIKSQDLLGQILNHPQFKHFTEQPQPGYYRPKSTTKNSHPEVISIDGYSNHETGKNIGLKELAEELGIIKPKPYHLPTHIYDKSKADAVTVKKYFETRGIDLSEKDIKSLGIRVNLYKNDLIVVVPMKNTTGDLIQIQRIVIDKKTFKKIDKRFSGSATEDRGLLVRRSEEILTVFEGIEDLLTYYQHAKDDSSLFCCFGTSGFSKMGSFIRKYKETVLILDQDKDDKSLKASACLGDSVQRKMPGLGIGIDINKALLDGNIAKWLKSLKDIPPPEPPAEQTTTYQQKPETEDEDIQKIAKSILRGLEKPDDFNFEHLPPALAGYIKEAGKTSKAHPIMILTSFLATLSACMRHKFFLPGINPQTKEYQWRGDLHPNLWCIAIAGSGQFKTTALNFGAEIVHTEEKKILDRIREISKHREKEDDNSDIEKLEKLRNILPNKTSTEGLFDKIKKSGGGVVLASEFGAWLSNLESSYNGSLKQTLTNWYDIPDFDEEQTRGKGNIVIEKPYISIAGVSTPQWISDNINVGSAIAGGFFARFLFFCPPEERKRPAALPPKEQPVREYRERIKQVFDYIDKQGEPVLFCINEQSRQKFELFHNSIYDIWESLPAEQQETIDPFVKRWSPYVLKLSMLMQLIIDKTSPLISIEALESSFHIVKYAIHSTIWLMKNQFTLSDFQEDTNNVLNYIASKGGKIQRHKLISSRQIKGTGKGKSKDYDEVVQFLVESGLIKVIAGKEKKNDIYKLSKNQ